MKKTGYVYVLSNECVVSRNKKRVLKVGFTSNLPRRLGTLNTSAPENFKVEALFMTDKYKDLEKVSKGYMKESLKTRGGSTTEFFEESLDTIVNRIKTAASHIHIKISKCDGSKYVGRSSSAIIKNLNAAKTKAKKTVKSKGNAWDNPTQLAKAILRKFDPSKTYGYVWQLLMRRAVCKSGLWRDRLERIGLNFDRNGKVKDWRKARRKL